MWPRHTTVVRVVLLLQLLLLLPTMTASSSATGNHRNAYADLPPSTFAPGGRLVSVEQTMQAISADTAQHNLVVAIRGKQGVVVVTSTVHSSYMEGGGAVGTKNQKNLSSSLLLVHHDIPRPPFCRLTNRLWGITAGSAIHAQLLRLQLHRVAEEAEMEMLDIVPNANASVVVDDTAMMARAIADQRHLATQSANNELWNATAILFDNHSLWRIEPSGQFYKCQAFVAGRLAAQAEATLLDQLHATVRRGTTNTPNTTKTFLNREQHLQHALATMSPTEAKALAVQVIRQTLSSSKIDNPYSESLSSEPPLAIRALYLPYEEGQRRAAVWMDQLR